MALLIGYWAAFLCGMIKNLMPSSLDAVLQYGELLEVGLTPFVVMLFELFQRPCPQACVFHAFAEFLALAIIGQVEVSQGREKRLQQGLKCRRIHPRRRSLSAGIWWMLIVGHGFPPCIFMFIAERGTQGGVSRQSGI